MNKSLLIVVTIIALIGLVSHPGCKKTEDAASYTLTVSLGTGVNGTPATGSYTYTENDVVNYNYSAQSGYGNLAVTLDGAPVANSGTVNMTASHTLAATADIDIRGDWTGRWTSPIYDVFFRATFAGGILSGTIDGHIDLFIGGGTERGTFTVTGSTIEFDMNYTYGTLYYQGTIESVSSMSGTWDVTNAIVAGQAWTLTR